MRVASRFLSKDVCISLKSPGPSLAMTPHGPTVVPTHILRGTLTEILDDSVMIRVSGDSPLGGQGEYQLEFENISGCGIEGNLTLPPRILS